VKLQRSRSEQQVASAAAGRKRAAAMTRVQRLLGAGLTLIIAAAGYVGLLDPMEYPTQDARARIFDRHSPPASNRLLIVGIDDRSLETIGPWPWPRELVALAVDELRLAGARTIALDIMFEGAQQPRLVEAPEMLAGVRQVRDDELLAHALAEHGRVILGGSFRILERSRQSTESRSAVVRQDSAYRAPFSQVYARVRADQTIDVGSLADLVPKEHRDHGMDYGPTYEDLRVKLGYARRLIERRDVVSQSVARTGVNLSMLPSSIDAAPLVPELVDAAASIGVVSFGTPDPDGVVRRIPLWVRLEDRLYPSLGLAAAAAYFGLTPSDLTITSEFTTGPPNTRFQRLPMHEASFRNIGRKSGLHYITWPGRGMGWWNRFPVEGDDAIVYSIGRLIESATLMDKIHSNLRSLDVGLLAAGEQFGLVDPALYAPAAQGLLAAVNLSPDDPALASQREVWRGAVQSARELLEMFEDESELTPELIEQRDWLANVVRDVPRLETEIVRGLQNLRSNRDDLRQRVNERTVFVGWTSTGAVADFVPTSVDVRTPGVLVHAAVFNAAITGRALVVGSSWLAWLNAGAVLMMGILGTIAGVRAWTLVGLALTALLAAAWFVVAGLLWDLNNLVVATAAPMLAVGATWLSIIMHRLIIEQRARRQTEARFRSYVSPDVVDILVNNPRLDTMRPQRRELTIMFSDVAAFTTLAERLGTEGIGKFLRVYLREMTDILQANRATLDKYLGDGILAFWGAPLDNPRHAIDAGLSAVQMIETIERLNAEGGFGEAGAIRVRIGLSTGEVSVGDFGNPPHKSSYTVIGDAANVAARLETANRFLGTSILMTRTTRDQIAGELAVRPIGRIVLKGKTESEELFELIGSRKPHGDRTQDWIQLTDDAVAAYIGGRLEECEELLQRLEDEFGDRLLSGVYRQAIRECREAGGPGPEWKGVVVLTEK